MREDTRWKKERHDLTGMCVQAHASSLLGHLLSARKRRGARGLPAERDREAWDGPPPARRSDELPSSQLPSAPRASLPAPRVQSVDEPCSVAVAELGLEQTPGQKFSPEKLF
jgi:hypothetical protein